MEHLSNAELTTLQGQLQSELDWLEALIDQRMRHYFSAEQPIQAARLELEPPPAHEEQTPYRKLISNQEFGLVDRITLTLALAPYTRPQLLDVFFTRNTVHDRLFTEFGGANGRNHRGFLPTFETVLFLLAGDHLPTRMQYLGQCGANCALIKDGFLVNINDLADHEPMTNTPLVPSRELLGILTSGDTYIPKYSNEFPAKEITTALEWHDLLLPKPVEQELLAFINWVQNREQILNDWQLGNMFSSGAHTLFYGPPGTGKTLTATLMGKMLNRSIYRIDLASVVSKYIGETEKNLANVFKIAEKQRWILFFDEADALFGERSNQANTANDRFANMQVSYLLQAIEEYTGIVIMASNLKTNIDSAFTRRLQSTIYFPAPDAELRAKHWNKITDYGFSYEESIDLSVLSAEFELTGAQIVNVLKYAVTCCATRDAGKELLLTDITNGIHSELEKEGKLL